MKIGISNIAWDPAEDEAVFQLLSRHRVRSVDVVPGKYIPDVTNPSEQNIRNVRDWWGARGIEITGMQALLFGTTGLNIFGDAASRAATLNHLRSVAAVASGLGARPLVFGSPRNRDRKDLANSAVENLAVSFFRDLAVIAEDAGVIFCLEPNPPVYGCNFMTTTQEAAAIVRLVDRPAIRLQLDTGAMFINREDPSTVIPQVADIIGHVHLSEPELIELGSADSPHAEVASALLRVNVAVVATIEMKRQAEGSNIDAIDRALAFAVQMYS